MTYTALPSIKGQITIPSEIRKKYGISKETPVLISDNNDGTIMIRIMSLVDHDDIVYTEGKDSVGITFKNGIDPQVLLKAIKKIDG